MFRRLTKPRILSRLKNFMWPDIGWGRTLQYWVLRIGRIKDSSSSIAGGFAFGAAMSFTPFVGLHFVLAAIFAWIFRLNILASAIGTVVGNPWTFPFIWIWIYNFGIWIGGSYIHTDSNNFVFTHLFGNILSAILELDFKYLVEYSWPVFFPMLLGSLPTSILAWIIFYVLCKFFLKLANR